MLLRKAKQNMKLARHLWELVLFGLYLWNSQFDGRVGYSTSPTVLPLVCDVLLFGGEATAS